MSRIRSSFRVPTLVAVLLLAGGLGTAVAQDAPASDGPQFNGGLSASLGTETITGTPYQYFGLQPDLGYGPFGVGFDLSFHFRFYEKQGGDFGFYPRAEDWWDSTLSTAQNVDKYLGRILYLRWGHKGDPLFARLGLLPSTTLGSGFLVGGYSNGALRPALRYTGLELDVSGELIGLPYGGFESFVGNISVFDVIGFRGYAKPFGLLMPDNSFTKDIQIGVTVAADTNPYAQVPKASSPGTALVTGMDTLVPLVSTEAFSALASLDLALQGSHTGASLGVGGKALGFLNWGLQNRFLGDNFLPNYFDRGYEISRQKKYTILNSSTVLVPGTIGWQISLGTSFLGDQLTFGAVLSGPWTSQSNVLAQPQLQSFAQVKAGLLPVSLDAFYVKNGLTSFERLASPEDALIGAKVGYALGAVTLSIVYDLRYLSANETGPNGDRWVTSSRLETAVKMF